MQLKQWERLVEAQDASIADFSCGPSPGGAANDLGITRQGVHAAIKRGDLDVLAIFDGSKLSHYTISQSSLAAYKATLRAKALRDFDKLRRRLA